MTPRTPRFYGGTVDQETSELYDERQPDDFGVRRDPSPKERAAAKARRKAAKDARRRNRR
jgi:hypothetical protein